LIPRFPRSAAEVQLRTRPRESFHSLKNQFDDGRSATGSLQRDKEQNRIVLARHEAARNRAAVRRCVVGGRVVWLRPSIFSKLLLTPLQRPRVLTSVSPEFRGAEEAYRRTCNDRVCSLPSPPAGPRIRSSVRHDLPRF
jgi:hypothetical protein